MKRTMFIFGGMLALAATAYVGTRLWAQGTGTQTAPAQVRVAFVNIETVFQGYGKAVTYKKEMEKLIEPFRVKAEGLKTDIIKWERELGDPASVTKVPEFNKERWAEGIKANKRQLEDLSAQVGKLVSKKNEEQVVQLYKEVNAAVQAHALANGFHAVLCYGQSTKLSPLSYENISRMVQGMEQTGCTSFMYIAPGLDISQAVTEALNRGYTGGATATTPTTTSGVLPTSGK